MAAAMCMCVLGSAWSLGMHVRRGAAQVEARHAPGQTLSGVAREARKPAAGPVRGAPKDRQGLRFSESVCCAARGGKIFFRTDCILDSF